MLVRERGELREEEGRRDQIESTLEPSSESGCADSTEEEEDSGDVSSRSTCPWELEQHQDNRRFPRVLNLVKCKCNACRSRGIGYHCEVIWHNQVVLRHNGTCIDGMYMYEPHLEPVTVGCTCTSTKTQSGNRSHRSVLDILQGPTYE